MRVFLPRTHPVAGFYKVAIINLIDKSWRYNEMTAQKHRVCPVERARGLDNKIRRWLQDPKRIIGAYIKDGMTVLDLGCGPGFFSLDMARMVGESGQVIACDLQKGMLDRLEKKIAGTELEKRVRLHLCKEDSIGVADQVDFVLAFYMVHEVPDKKLFFNEISNLLKAEGKLLLVEPPFHVSKATFEKTVEMAGAAGLRPVDRPRVSLSKAVLLQKE